MATAQRVKQDPKVVIDRQRQTQKTEIVMTVNGVEKQRIPYFENTEIVDAQRSVPQPDRVVLNLSLDEAETLCAIFRQVGGAADSTRRYDVDNIYKAMQLARVDCLREPGDSLYTHSKYGLNLFSSLQFTNTGDPLYQHQDRNKVKPSPTQGGPCSEGAGAGSPAGTTGGASTEANRKMAAERSAQMAYKYPW